MGKKSRKKGGGKVTKAARKERLQERREQQLEDLDDRHEEQHLERPREFFEGDRVWFRERSLWGDGTNPNNYRGYVKRVRENSLDIIPLQSKIDGTDASVRVPLVTRGEEFVFPDFCDFTLRFDVGEEVLCSAGVWQPREVRILWPIGEIILQGRPVPQRPGDSVPTYKCVDGESAVAAPEDDDDCVMRRPGHPFRFRAGDRVVFDARKARFGSEALRVLRGTGDPWLEGTVVSVDVTGREGYASYECSVGNKFSCQIFRDNDEHIAGCDADPRERLFEAIEQQCSRGHLKYLAEAFQIDVSTFRDLAVQKSLQVASYQALLWLECECGTEVLQIKDSDGNSILHKIAATPHAANFIREARRMTNMDEKVLNIDDAQLTSSLNDRGETWLQVLVQRGDIKALDAALSPHVGLAWDLLYFPKDKRALLESSIIESGNAVMKCIFDSFVSFQNLLEQFSDIKYGGENEDELLERESMAVFLGDDASRHAKLLSRFISDWSGCSVQLRSNPFLQLVKSGSYRLFKLFFEADESMFPQKDVYRTYSKEDRNDYIQPELAPQMEEFTSYDCIYVDILTACIIGGGGPMTGGSVDSWWQGSYLQDVRQHCISCDHNDCASWHASLKDMMQVTSSYAARGYKEHLEQRIKTMEDDENLEGRLKILEYLLNHDRNAKVDVLEALRHRQCGVLRFMVRKDLLKLQAHASSISEFKKRASELQFLDNGCIPDSMSTQSFLCFAAVQYDDLQSLQWLSDLSPLLNELCNGWNLLHFAAFMGRVEIIGWMSTQPAWQSLVSEVCRRKPFQNAYALHIAVIQGHIYVADLMLALKVPEADNKQKMPEHWAKKSKHKFVKEWGLKREKPQALERDTRKLLHLVDAQNTTSERVQEFIIKSKCLDLKVWRGCGHNSFEEKGPLGYSIADVVRKCCSKRSSDPDFVLWLLATKYFEQDYSYGSNFWKPNGGYDNSQHPVTMMNCSDLIAFTEHEGYGDIAGYLRNTFCREIVCVDPIEKHALLKSAIGESENGQFLLEIRSKLLRVVLLDKITFLSARAIKDLLKRGCNPEVLDEVFQIGSAVKKTLIDEGYDSGFDEIHSSLLKPTDMAISTFVKYDDGHSLFKQLAFQGHTRHDLGAPNIVLATEGFHQLLEYCLRNWGGWTAEMETETARIAAFYGHSSIVDLFLSADNAFVSDASDRAQAAINGAGEACRCRDLARLLARHGSVSDPIKEEKPPVYESAHEDHGAYWKRSATYMAQSLMCSLLNGYIRDLYDSNFDDRKELKSLKMIVNEVGYTHGEILLAIDLLLNKGGWSREWAANVVVLLQAVTEALQLQPAMHSVQINSICGDVEKAFLEQGMLKEKGKERNPDAEMATQRAVLSWIEKMAQSGVPIASLQSSMKTRLLFKFQPETKSFADEHEKIVQDQRQLWSQFDCVKNGQSLEKIQTAIEEGILDIDRCDRGGGNLTHISAAYNRVDLLEWLVVTKKMDMLSKDSEGRTALEIAKAAKATGTTQWIMELESKRTIAAFLKRNHRRIMAMRKQKRLAKAASTIQKCFRGHSVRRIYSGLLLNRLKESHRFSAVWGNLIESLADLEGGASNWSYVREKTLDIQHADFSYDDEYFKDTDEQLSQALEGALQVHNEDVEMDQTENNEALAAAQKESCVESESKERRNALWLQFQMTSHVIKFLKRGDPKYKSFFVRRLQQLANGERSRILQKRLKGSDSAIYETYLEQKSGFRILWTEEGERIIIWFVAKHKEVSRLMKLIDDSKSRTVRQQLPESLVAELQNDSLLPPATRKEVLLDLFGNVPLKLYDFTFHSIDEITTKSWTPRLHLTAEERDVVEAEGTALVLGRSGTGKTVCICNRMEYDRQKYHLDQTFSQLFVARSKRLCRYVAEATCDQNSCHTFEELLHELDSSLPRLKNNDRHFFPSQRVEYQRFKQEFHSIHSQKENKAGALYVWTAIRTFIEGSLEAFQSPDGVLSKDDFVAVEKLGKNRCRIPTVDLREGIYDEFLRYQAYKQRFGLWDDCDRIKQFLLRLEETKKIDPLAFDQVRRSKVYVDEIQDYTQIECLIFFYLGGPSGLFLAGDPAQSVVEGTEFRFEEIRSLGHFVAGNDRSLIPQKPKIINVNFRTHAGVLNCASAFLDLLFRYFPGSARQLRDVGFFQGSRPGLLYKVDVKNLTTLLSDKFKGTVVLCHDESARHWQHALGGYQLVYGIREAKGLEFRHVILLDFFRELPAGLQKPWRDLLLNRAGVDFEKKHPLIGTHLKLLYTGITRCIERLFFVETLGSVAGDAVVRWLTSVGSGKQQATQRNALATRNIINDIEAMAMTSDEFLSSGFDDAEVAELENIDLERALASLDRAVFCFEQANNSPLAAKARTHRRSIQLRIDLASRHNEMSKNDQTIAEMATAQLMESLVKEGLLLEVLNLFYAISPGLSSYAKRELERRFISKIRLANEYQIH